MDEQSPITDDFLIQAARRSLLRRLEQGGGGDAERIVNNIYGGGGAGGGGGGMGGMLEAMGGSGGGAEDPFDYFVEINRRDVEAPGGVDEEGNPIMKKIGWDKSVHRFRGSKKKAPMSYLPVDPADPGVP